MNEHQRWFWRMDADDRMEGEDQFAYLAFINGYCREKGPLWCAKAEIAMSLWEDFGVVPEWAEGAVP